MRLTTSSSIACHQISVPGEDDLRSRILTALSTFSTLLDVLFITQRVSSSKLERRIHVRQRLALLLLRNLAELRDHTIQLSSDAMSHRVERTGIISSSVFIGNKPILIVHSSEIAVHSCVLAGRLDIFFRSIDGSSSLLCTIGELIRIVRKDEMKRNYALSR